MRYNREKEVKSISNTTSNLFKIEVKSNRFYLSAKPY